MSSRLLPATAAAALVLAAGSASSQTHDQHAPAVPAPHGAAQPSCPMGMGGTHEGMTQHMAQMQQMMESMQQMRSDMQAMREQMTQMRQQMQPHR